MLAGQPNSAGRCQTDANARECTGSDGDGDGGERTKRLPGLGHGLDEHGHQGLGMAAHHRLDGVRATTVSRRHNAAEQAPPELSRARMVSNAAIVSEPAGRGATLQRIRDHARQCEAEPPLPPKSRSMDLIEISPPAYDVVIDACLRHVRQRDGGADLSAGGLLSAPRRRADCLAKAIELAAPLGYRLKIFDAFRPSEAQWVLWKQFPQPGFFADPRKGSPHSRGAAVDLTLVDTRGAELEMGTGFDDLTERAYHACLEVSATAQRNRAILLGLMTAAGWDFYRNEWWHYQLFNARRYPLYSDSA